ncbi:hypothetical protein ASD64_07060 [Mesorhizobium sp. Root157]|uniref:hypothetical protein n=1 Tax=Mesorhizobium sp. Root157 TaxID=1736477 RepID=UPI0006FF3857|nr:hypothetical protein [Mesorhizobium sp. Root157]KQZ87194.1 hypothetical protein ASD64_07060 [Mesorhizobium sp. Root157]
MRNQVMIRPRQQFLADDAGNMQAYTRASFDEAFRATVGASKRFYGFLTEKTGPAEIKVASGLLYASGPIHGRDVAVNIDMIGNLPVAAQKMAVVVAWAVETETDIERRNFRTDVTTNAVEPQDVAMRRARVANVDVVYGQESANPQVPPIDPGYVHIATVTLSTTGVELVEMNEAARLKSIQDIFSLATQIDLWRQIAEPLISTIRTDIAALADKLRASASSNTLEQLLYDVALLKDTVGIDEDAVSYGADRYLNLDKMDLTHGASDCRVEEGIRPNWDNITEQALQLFNPLDPVAIVDQATGQLLPKYTEEARIRVEGFAGDIALNQYASQAITLTQRSVTRTRIRYGQSMNVCTNAQWWRSGQYDPASGIFRRAGEVWEVAEADRPNAVINHRMVRVTQFWTDSWQEPYWDATPTETVINGAVIGQTMLDAQGGWYLGSDFAFTQIAADGAVTMAVCEVTAGAPDVTKVIASVTKQPADLKPYPQWTRFGIPPIYRERGKRYATVLISQGSHHVALADNNAYLNGSLFYSSDGGWFTGDLTRDLLFRAIYARFTNPRAVIELTPVSLAGGITDLDFLYESIAPEGTSIDWEIQPEGQAVWSRLVGGEGQSLLYNKPALVKIRAVFNGTSDVQPMLKLTNSRLRATRSKSGFTGVSEEITLPAAANTVTVTSYLGYFHAPDHTAAIKLVTGAGDVTASVVEDRVAEIGIRRKATFNLGAPITQFRIKHVGTAVSDRDLFQINETVWNSY